MNVQSSNGSTIVIPDFGQGSTSTVLNTQTSKINVCSPLAKEVERPRTKYTPLGEKGCNLLNANLLLSDSYINYLSDRSLDCTNACVCQPTDRKFAVRHLSMGKEPIGFTRGPRSIDVCSCGLRTFEGEKLQEHGGLFSADIRDVGSCMDDLGVAVDERYFDKGTTTTNSCPVEKKIQVKKELPEDIKPCESADSHSASNSAAVMEYLLDQFSSPLSAAATSEKITMTEVGDKDEDSPLCRKSGGTK